MKKIITIIFILFFAILAGLYYYFNKDSLLNNKVNINHEGKKNKNVSEEKKYIASDFRSDNKLKDINDFLKKAEDGQDKAVALYLKSDYLLAKRDIESLLLSINSLKESYKITQDTKRKGRILEKLASRYWRTGGDDRIFKEVFSGDFKKFLVDKKDKNYKIKSILNLFKEAYKLNPTPRSAIEIVFYNSYLENTKDSEKWLKIAENFDSKYKNQNYLYKELLTYFNLYRNTKNSDLLVKIDKNYYEIEEILKASGLENYDNEDIQSIPFLWMFYAVHLKNIGGKEEEIKTILSRVVDHVEGDPKPKQNEFKYFLAIQKDKKERDLLGADLNDLGKISPKFKAFLEKYGFIIK